MRYFCVRKTSGQSLVEVLIATALGVIFIIAAVSAVVPALRGNSYATKNATALELARESLDGVITLAQSDWHTIAVLTPGTVQYNIETTESPFYIYEGYSEYNLGGVNYGRYFIIDDVYRDGSGVITTNGGTYDPSTKKITVYYSFDGQPAKSLSGYLTRTHLSSFTQTDWSGGAVGDTAVTTVSTSTFSASINVSYASTTGAFTLSGF